jgi:hypothetical protein
MDCIGCNVGIGILVFASEKYGRIFECNVCGCMTAEERRLGFNERREIEKEIRLKAAESALEQIKKQGHDHQTKGGL